MVVFLMEKVSVSLRGEITRWMLELKPGVLSEIFQLWLEKNFGNKSAKS